VGSYKVLIKASAVKELEALPKTRRPRVASRIQRLVDDPRPPGCEKLSREEKYRVRQGTYRVVYEISDAERTVLIVKIAHRKDVYR
jgi:mRNA interferase RelE/StbE